MIELKRRRMSQLASSSHKEMGTARRARHAHRLWLIALLLGALIGDVAHIHTQDAWADEGSPSAAEPVGIEGQPVTTQQPSDSTEGDEMSEELTGDIAEAPLGTTEEGQAPAEDLASPPEPEVVLTRGGTLGRAFQNVAAMAQHRPLAVALGAGAVALAIASAWYASSRYRSRPYALRRRRRHYVS